MFAANSCDDKSVPRVRCSSYRCVELFAVHGKFSHITTRVTDTNDCIVFCAAVEGRLAPKQRIIDAQIRRFREERAICFGAFRSQFDLGAL